MLAARRPGVVCACVCGLLCVAVPAPAQLATRLVVSGLTAPLEFVQDPSDPAVQFIVEQGGRIRVLRAGALHRRTS